MKDSLPKACTGKGRGTPKTKPNHRRPRTPANMAWDKGTMLYVGVFELISGSGG
jgi:hypothetical protein